MKRYATIYYLLFVLLIMGAFASIAQNAYGLKICGIACLGFALTFLHETFFTPRLSDDQLVSSWIFYTELIFLSAIAFAFLFRNFSIDFRFADTILMVSSIFLLAVFSYQTILQIRLAGHQIKLVWQMALYYGAVLFFILSLLASIIFPGHSNGLAIIAIVLITIFTVVALVFKKVTINNETISIWQYTRQMKNKSPILLIASTLFFGYILLNSAGVLPSFYYGTPKGYQNLVRMSNTGNPGAKEKPREFKERYEEFIRKHGTN